MNSQGRSQQKIHLLEKEHFPRVIDETIKARR